MNQGGTAKYIPSPLDGLRVFCSLFQAGRKECPDGGAGGVFHQE